MMYFERSYRACNTFLWVARMAASHGPIVSIARGSFHERKVGRLSSKSRSLSWSSAKTSMLRLLIALWERVPWSSGGGLPCQGLYTFDKRLSRMMPRRTVSIWNCSLICSMFPLFSKFQITLSGRSRVEMLLIIVGRPKVMLTSLKLSANGRNEYISVLTYLARYSRAMYAVWRAVFAILAGCRAANCAGPNPVPRDKPIL